MKRLEGIGGTDVGCLLGVGFKSPYELWEEKTGRGKEFSMNEAMRWGLALEDVLRVRYAEETGHKVDTIEPVRHPKHEWWVGSPDGVTPDRVLEIKTARFQGDDWGNPGTDQVPMGYYCQVQWYMAALSLDKADIAVLFSGQDFAIYHVERDDKCLKSLYKKAKSFWEKNVKEDIPPEEMSAKEQQRYLGIKYPNDDGEIKVVGNDDSDMKEAEAMESLLYIKKEIEVLKERKEEIEAEIKSSIGPNKGMQSDLYRATWTPQTRKTMDQSRFKAMVADEIGSKRAQEMIEKCKKENSYRVLRLTERKQ
ncbi:MAG: hypothetical protein HN738_02555 [Gammaproteobacteria bacterium]|jgi:putative phage-type endonuclease|nr:hypothetical protein [Gammaproteobacteria bacterium]